MALITSFIQEENFTILFKDTWFENRNFPRIIFEQLINNPWNLQVFLGKSGSGVINASQEALGGLHIWKDHSKLVPSVPVTPEHTGFTWIQPLQPGPAPSLSPQGRDEKKSSTPGRHVCVYIYIYIYIYFFFLINKWMSWWLIKLHQQGIHDFPSGPMVKNPPAIAGNTGWVTSPGKSQTPQGN